MSLLLYWVLVSDTMMSVHVIEAKFLLLEVCTTTSSPSIWHLKSVHITEAKFLLRKVYYYIESQYLTPWCQYTWLRQSFYCRRYVLLHWVPVSDTWNKYTSLRPKVSITTLCQNIWHMKSVHITETKVLLLEVSTTTLSPSIWQWRKYLILRPSSTARGQYNYIESKYLTHEVSTHHWGQVSTARGQYYYIEALYLTQLSVHITETKYLLLEVNTSTSSQSFWHMKSDHITEAKVLLLEVTTTTLSPSFWHHDVSTHGWGKVSTARGQYNYIESQYLTHEVSTHHWGQGSTARGQYYYIESQFQTPWCQYTWLKQSFYC